MNGEEFLQEHARWKHGTKTVIEDEVPCTWLMSKSGHFFPFKDRKVLDSELGKGMFCIHLNATSLTMRAEQEIRIHDRR
jgi:hypothetical protein